MNETFAVKIWYRRGVVGLTWILVEARLAFGRREVGGLAVHGPGSLIGVVAVAA